MHTLVRTRSLLAGVKGIIASYPIGGTHACCAPFGIPSTSRWTGAAIWQVARKWPLGRMGVRSDGFQVALRSVH